MKVAVNTRLLLKNKLEGIGWFSYEILKRLAINYPQHEFVFLFDRPFSKEFIFSKNVVPIVISPQARHPFLYYIWFNYSVRRVLEKQKVDVFFSPDGYLSLTTKIPQIQVIHDIAFEHYPEYYSILERKYYQHYFPKYAEIAKKIITVSEYTKKDIVDKYKISKDKITVAYNGAANDYKPIEENEKNKIREKYTQGNQFFVYVGSINERKNIVSLLQAFDVFCEKNIKIKLVIIGAKMWKNENINKVYKSIKNKNNVIFTGRLPQNELVKVVASAMALVYISFFEGFGIPIVEAMKCGTPVITSNTSSMKEIAEGVGILVNPYSIDEISNAMFRIAQGENYQQNLSNLGLKKAEEFSWDKSAEIIGKVIFNSSLCELD